MEKKENPHRNASNQEGNVKFLIVRNIGFIKIYDIFNKISISSIIFKSPLQTSKLQENPTPRGKELKNPYEKNMFKGKGFVEFL